MRLVIAPDKFKGCLSAAEAAAAMARGARAAGVDAIELVPMADGGEGIVDALVAATAGTNHQATVTGPLGKPVVARFGRLGDGNTFVLEMSAASGLVLIDDAERDPFRTTTWGTGELLREAVRLGAGRVILGIGGSATNDGGAGFAQAIGYRLLDRDGQEIGPGGGPLANLDRIERPGESPLPAGFRIDVACDVTNPLCGPIGASAVYGPQKGATTETIPVLDANLDRFARIIARDLGVEVRDVPGAGAAGGLGAGLLAFANGHLRPGIDLVIEAVGLADRLRGADLCLTGEGSLDASSAHGKTVSGVAKLARSLGVPTVAVAGTLGPDRDGIRALGIDAAFSLCPRPISLAEAMSDAAELLANATEEAIRAVRIGGRHGTS